MVSVSPQTPFTQFLVKKLHAKDAKTKELTFYPNSFRTVDKDTKKFLKVHDYSVISATKPSADDFLQFSVTVSSLESCEIARKSGKLDESVTELVLQAETKDHRNEILDKLRSMMQAAVVISSVQDASKVTNFSKLLFSNVSRSFTTSFLHPCISLLRKAVWWHSLLPPTEYFAAEKTIELAISSKNGSVDKEKALIMLDRAKLLYSSCDYLLAISDISSVLNFPSGTLSSDSKSECYLIRSSCYLALAQIVLEQNESLEILRELSLFYGLFLLIIVCVIVAELALSDYNFLIVMNTGFFSSAKDPFPSDKKSSLLNLLGKLSVEYKEISGSFLPHVFRCYNKHSEIVKDRDLRKRDNLDQLTAAKIASLPSKTELHLSGNRFKEINSSQFAVLSELEHLDLNENSLKVIQCSWFDCLPKLITLCLENNKCSSLEGKFRLPKLQSLWLGANRIASVETIINACDTIKTTLKSLRLAGNPFVEELFHKSDLQHFNVSYRFPVLLAFESLIELDLVPIRSIERREAHLHMHSPRAVELAHFGFSPDPTIEASVSDVWAVLATSICFYLFTL